MPERDPPGKKAPSPPKPAPAQRPPTPSRPGEESLAEVERALSILHGRHPEAVRAERETLTSLANKKAAVDRLAQEAAREDRQRLVVRAAAGAVAAAVVLTAGIVVTRRIAQARAIDAAIAPAAAPFEAKGFSNVAPSRFTRQTQAIESEEPTCYVAVASRSPGDGALALERPSGTLRGEGSLAWCTCGSERDTVRLADAAAGGLRVLRAPAKEIGGDQGLFFLSPRPHAIAVPDECSGESLDAWIEQGRAPAIPAGSALDPKLREALGGLGFEPAGSAAAPLPFAVVAGADDTCSIAWSSAPDDTLTLRVPGGERPLAHVKGTVAFCQSHGKPVTVWREGSGELQVARAPAGRVGGTHGVRELVQKVGLPAASTWSPDDDLAWDAAATLRAAGIPSPEITVSTDGQSRPNARLLSTTIRGALVRADAPPNASFVCAPPIEAGTESALCVQSAALAWHVVGTVGKAGFAQAALPFWMQALSGTTEPEALKAQLALVQLGRRLAAEGYEATTLVGVTERGSEVVVTGRAGDDAIVAVQLTREPPWAAPCTMGTTWTLEGPPGVVPLRAGDDVILTCAAAGARPHDPRTVVFRHVGAAKPG